MKRGGPGLFTVLAVCACSLAWTHAAAAQASPDHAAATALFDEALALKDAGRIDQACAKFAASAKIAPSVGADLNLADCAEREGKTATAWLLLRDAEALAARNGDATRREFASRHAASLEPRLTRVVVQGAPRNLPGLVILWNGDPMDLSLVGQPVPVDPGKLTLEARAPGYRPWTSTVAVAADAGVLSIAVPPLEPITTTAAPAAHEQAASAPAAKRTWAWILGGAGAAALGVGGVLGVLALSDAHQVTSACPRAICPDAATAAREESTRSQAASFATVSTIGFIAGGVLLASSLVLVLVNER